MLITGATGRRRRSGRGRDAGGRLARRGHLGRARGARAHAGARGPRAGAGRPAPRARGRATPSRKAAFGPGGLRAVVEPGRRLRRGAPLHETSLEDFEKLFRLNLRPTFLVTRAAVPYMLDAGGGSIVCVSARAAVQPFGGRGRLRLVEGGGARVRAGRRGRLPRSRRALQRGPAERRRHAGEPQLRNPTPTTRAGSRRREIAGVIRFLCSDDSAPVSGAAVPVYGRA